MTGEQLYSVVEAMQEIPAARLHYPGIKDSRHTAYVVRYMDLGIGWKIAEGFARAKERIPLVLEASDIWIHRAFMYHLGHRDRIIEEVDVINTYPALRGTRDVLKAALVSPDVNIGDLANSTGISAEVIGAFERLCFNVVSRQRDSEAIRRHVFPDFRIKEMFEDYVANEASSDLLLRAGYQRGMNVALRLAGYVGGNLVGPPQTSAQLAEVLESTTLANAILQQSAGFGFQRANNVGGDNAYKLVAAAKQGGTDNSNASPIATQDSEDVFVKQMMSYQLDARRKRAAAMSAAAQDRDKF